MDGFLYDNDLCHERVERSRKKKSIENLIANDSK